MAEFQKVIKERKRMCGRYKICDGCPIKAETLDKGDVCLTWIMRKPEEAEHIIMKWAAEHPIKTNGMKFREVFGEDMMAMLTGEHAPLDDWLDAEYKGGQDEQ